MQNTPLRKVLNKIESANAKAAPQGELEVLFASSDIENWIADLINGI
jgi:hypothetical protein